MPKQCLPHLSRKGNFKQIRFRLCLFLTKRRINCITFDHIPSAPTKRSPSNFLPSSNIAVTYTQPTNTASLETGNGNSCSQIEVDMATKTYLLIHLTAIIYKIDYMASIQYSIITNCSSKDLLQRHAANDPCDWEPPLSGRSKRIKLDVPESNLALSNGCLQQRNI